MRIRLIFISIIVIITQFSCGPHCEHENYRLNNAFVIAIDASDYCEKIESSLEGDSMAFREILDPPVNTGLIIDHPNVISQLILDIGLESICSWIESGVINEEELMEVLSFSTYKYVLCNDEDYFTAAGNFKCP
jgi:hypothetical protein